MSIFKDQKKFMLACDQVIAGGLNVETRLWERLIREEYHELLKDFEAFHISPSLDNIARMSKEAIDLIYVLAGLLNNLSVPADEVWAAVHQSNMAKVDSSTGKVEKRPDGKILKPFGWQAPDILSILLEARNARS
jgi:predicted HAD superfamily Cof-like phosphohydrolase